MAIKKNVTFEDKSEEKQCLGEKSAKKTENKTDESEPDVICASYNRFSQLNPNVLNKLEFCCLLLNIQSFNKNGRHFFRKIEPFLDYIHLIVLNETWMKDDKEKTNLEEEVNNFFLAKGFVPEFKNRKHKNCGGVGMYIKEQYAYKIRDIETKSFENLTVELDDKSISVIYRPPDLKIPEFNKELVKVLDMKKRNFILGDTNIDENKSNISSTRNYKKVQKLWGLWNIVKEDTRVTTTTSTLLDHVLVDSLETKYFSSVIKERISDHFVVLVGVFPKTETNIICTDSSKLAELNEDNIEKLIQDSDWSLVLKETKLEKCFKLFLKQISEIYRRSPHATDIIPARLKRTPSQCNALDTIRKNFPQIVDEHEIKTFLQNLDVPFEREHDTSISVVREIDLKNHIEIFAPIVTKLVNLTLQESIVPTEAYTKFPSFVRILEQIVESKVLNLYKSKSLFQYTSRQDEFKSKNRLLGDMSNVLNRKLNDVCHVLVLFVDFALGQLDSSVLTKLEKAERYLPDFLRNYSYQDNSKLGKLVLLLHVNRMRRKFQRLEQECSINLFSFNGETAILVSNKKLAICEKVMQTIINDLEGYSGLEIDWTKTEIMPIHPPRMKIDKAINLTYSTAERINIVNKHKYLNLVFDQHLCWEAYIADLATILEDIAFRVKNSEYVPAIQSNWYQEFMKAVNYGILAWGAVTKTKLAKIQRIVAKVYHYLASDLRNNIKYIPLKTIFEATVVLEYCDDVPLQLSESSQHVTRRQIEGLYTLPRVHNKYGERQASYILPLMLNSLRPDLRISKDKEQLEQYFFLP